MSEFVTLELPSNLVREAKALAASTNKRFEDAVAEWIERAVAEPTVATLPDAKILSVCESQLPEALQTELSRLLTENRDGTLLVPDRDRLETLLSIYRSGLILKARALKEAVARGLKPRLDEHAA